MHRLFVAFTAYDGHTAKMAERIASSLREDDCADEVCDPARLRPERPVHEYDGVIGGGPTRCLNELLDETGWKPSATAIVAGALLYRKYSIFRRCCGVLFRRNANPADAQSFMKRTEGMGVDSVVLKPGQSTAYAANQPRREDHESRRAG